jgi:hypothetical protein
MGDVAMTVPVLMRFCSTVSRGENYRGVEAVLSLFFDTIPSVSFFCF